MNINLKSTVIACSAFAAVIISLPTAKAGNGDRVGQAGATELLINPWAKSTGWASANSGAVRGVEAMFLNVAGTAFTRGTEVMFTNTQWLKGSGISINAVGLNQSLGESGGVLGINVMTMSTPDEDITKTDQPAGGNGIFRPSMTNVGLTYAKEFSNSIFGGLGVKAISETFGSVSAQGVAFDAGIQYVAGKKQNLKFGITLKNVGPTMRFSGDGLSTKVRSAQGFDYTINNRAEQFEIPSLLNIGAAYDFHLAEDHRITAALAFNSNSFTNDSYHLGAEYGFKKFLMLRAGYTIFGDDKINTVVDNVQSGLSAGLSLQLPLGKSGKNISFDYSFRQTVAFDNTHSFGVKLSF